MMDDVVFDALLRLVDLMDVSRMVRAFENDELTTVVNTQIKADDVRRDGFVGMQVGVFKLFGDVFREGNEIRRARKIPLIRFLERAVIVERARLGIRARERLFEMLLQERLHGVFELHGLVGIDRDTRREIKDVQDGFFDDNHVALFSPSAVDFADSFSRFVIDFTMISFSAFRVAFFFSSMEARVRAARRRGTRHSSIFFWSSSSS